MLLRVRIPCCSKKFNAITDQCEVAKDAKVLLHVRQRICLFEKEEHQVGAAAQDNEV